MANYTFNIWKQVKYAGDIYGPWPIWPPKDPIFHRPSLFQTNPLRHLVNSHIFGEIKRNAIVGTTNNDKGVFELIDSSVGIEKFSEALMCSSAVPALFPY
mmetsp:Transcript_24399/g.4064  ORF Transcript_24399/g.4064 Transcript_24399/m.4064 type:complete len:100 (+) Transcript_24399:238-537(+)